MATVSTTLPSDGQTIDAADVNTPINAIITQVNGNIDADNLADGVVTATKIDFGGAGVGIWWEEIGRTTLSGAGDTITVSSLPARKYLRIIVTATDTGGTINGALTFNNDTSANYAYRTSVSFDTGTTQTSQSNIAIGTASTAHPFMSTIDVFNIATDEKVVRSVTNGANTAGAGNAPISRENFGKWVNTSDQINRVDVVNSGTGDFGIGSSVVVLGHD